MNRIEIPPTVILTFSYKHNYYDRPGLANLFSVECQYSDFQSPKIFGVPRQKNKEFWAILIAYNFTSITSIRSNIVQKPFATGAPPQTPLMEFKTLQITYCRLRRTVDTSIRLEWALLIDASHEINVKRCLYTKKSNIIGYQYSPKFFIFCLGTPNILGLWKSEYWHSTLKRFANPGLWCSCYFRQYNSKFNRTVT